jgi:hypothetical protein
MVYFENAFRWSFFHHEMDFVQGASGSNLKWWVDYHEVLAIVVAVTQTTVDFLRFPHNVTKKPQLVSISSAAHQVTLSLETSDCPLANFMSANKNRQSHWPYHPNSISIFK